jgi:hypothetical protein
LAIAVFLSNIHFARGTRPAVAVGLNYQQAFVTNLTPLRQAPGLTRVPTEPKSSPVAVTFINDGHG